MEISCFDCRSAFVLDDAFAGITECPVCGKMIDVQALIDQLRSLGEEIRQQCIEEEMDE